MTLEQVELLMICLLQYIQPTVWRLVKEY